MCSIGILAVSYKHLTEMGKRARNIAEEQFDRPQSYKKIIELIEELTGNE